LTGNVTGIVERHGRDGVPDVDRVQFSIKSVVLQHSISSQFDQIYIVYVLLLRYLGLSDLYPHRADQA
jgi:hypothetical protein